MRQLLGDVAVAFILFGSLAGRSELVTSANSAVQELITRGYTVSTSPLRMYPLTRDAKLPLHAAGWRPGVISVREGAQELQSLRHELMHQASHETCKGRLPLWAEEAQAMAFAADVEPGPANEADLQALREAVRISAPLKPRTYDALRSLIKIHGWPERPCEMEPTMSAFLEVNKRLDGTPLSYAVISLPSTRVMEQRGALDQKLPPGSVLKLPYAAALTSVDEKRLGSLLLKSDTQGMLELRASFNRKAYADFFPERLKDSAFTTDGPPLLGERREDGSYPFELSIIELASLVRLSIFEHAERFRALSRNGEPDSTLANANQELRAALRRLKAIAKTGTAADAQGKPLVGTLLLAWPAEYPAYLALFRQGGMSGAELANRVSPLISEISRRYQFISRPVRVRILSLLSRDAFSIRSDCPVFQKETRKISSCGTFILNTECSPIRERRVRGILDDDQGRLILETDTESYADEVLRAEADGLPKEAERALRAVIVHNALFGSRRHAETKGLCDNTHCMVFLGEEPGWSPKQGMRTDSLLLAAARELSKRWDRRWLPFAKGGVEPWERNFNAQAISNAMGEAVVLSVQRDRARDGGVFVQLSYPDRAERVPCEVFRAKLKLPSCPDEIIERSGELILKGIGAGHGVGLQVEEARNAAERGMSADGILQLSYGNGRK